MSRRFKLIFFKIIPLSLFLLSIGYIVYFQKQGNFHTITPGEAYRSAQLNRHILEDYIKKYNIKSILNLRSDNVDTAWYKEEAKVCKDNSIAYYSVPLSAVREPTDREIAAVVEVFKSAPRPILIHCKGGADRSGLVAAMWKVIVDKEPKSEAKKQLSPLFFHFAIGRTAAMDKFFKKWQP